MTRLLDIVERRVDKKVVPLRTNIHPTAIVHPNARLGAGVQIGPYAIIGENVEIGDETQVGPHCVIEGWTCIGKRNRIYTGAVVGNEPQDLKFRGEKSYLFIGDNNLIREYASISRGTAGGGGETRLGNNNLIMSYVHVAHDVQMGSHVVVGHGSGIAGHVTIEDRVIIGGIVGVHQFSKIGRLAMLGAHSMITKDVPPYTLVDGNPAKAFGPNIVGLRRNGYSPEVRLEIQRALRILYRTGYSVSKAIEVMEQELAGCQEIDHFIRFLRSCDRGICR
ncbi:MAG: acyl-ACP--UDP-N-acetylglucosamine O-acyltransferase [Limnochordia bacterium]